MQQHGQVGPLQQTRAEVEEGQRADGAGDPPQEVDEPVADRGGDGGDHGEDDDARGVAQVRQLTDRLPGQDRAAGEEADVHHDDQGQRHHRAAHPELRPGGDHLRQAEARPLRGVQRHDRAAEEVAEQQADQGPEGVGAEHDGQGAGDDGGDLQVGAEPEGELADRRAVAFVVRDDVDRALFHHCRHRLPSSAHRLYELMQDLCG